MEPMTPSRRMTAERAHADLLREGALDRQVSVERRRMPQSWLRGIFAVSFLVGAGSCAGAVMGTEAILAIWPVSVIVMLASAMALSSERAARWRPGKLVALPTGGVGVLGAKDAHVRAEEVVAGWIEEPHRAMVETRRGDVVGVACASPEEARAVLASVGVVRPRAVLRVALSSGADRTPAGRAMAVVGIAVASMAAFFSFLALLLGLRGMSLDFGAVFAMIFFSAVCVVLVAAIRAMLGFMSRRDVVLGADGLTLPHRDLYVPFRDVTRWSRHRRGVSLVRADGTVIELPTWARGEPPLDTPAAEGTTGAVAQATLAAKIAEGVDAARSPATSEALALLERAGRSRDEWRAALLALPRSGVTYRVAGVDNEPLEKAIVDGAAPLERRVAAAVALRARAPEAAERAVRIAVESTAHADTARVLAAAGEGEIDEEWLEEEAKRARRL